MIEFIVCDDNKVIRNNIEKIINKIMMKNEWAYETRIFEDYDETFLKLIQNMNANKVYILDIEVPSESGIDIARRIRRKDKQSSIIFLTSHDELGYALLTSRLNFLTFVSKMDDYENNLTNAIKESLKYIGVKKSIDFIDHGVSFSIPILNILYIYKDSFDRKSIIRTDNNEYKVYIPLSKLAEELGSLFVKTHRSCIVNKERVESINFMKKIIYFDNGTTSDLISDIYKKEIVKE